VLPRQASEQFAAAAKAAFESVRVDYASIEDPAALALELEAVPLPAVALGDAETRRVLDFWALAPCSPMRMSPDVAGFVETSCAFTTAHLHEGTAAAAEFSGLARTSRDSQWADIERRMEALAGIVGGTLEITDRFAGWLPQPTSTLAKIAQEAHQSIFGRPSTVYTIHAGLECGIIMKKVPNLEAISIGPKIENPHTVQERVNIKTVETYYAWLTHIIRLLN
jgi:dipeptidase D